MKIWLMKKRTEVLRDWVSNKISYSEAIQRMTDLGLPLEIASQLLAHR